MPDYSMHIGSMLVFRGDPRFELVEVERRPPGTGEVELEVIAAGICGSDVHGYAGVNDRRPPGTVMGHEVVGRIAGSGELAGRGDAARARDDLRLRRQRGDDAR